MTGTASIRATATGVELRQGNHRVVLHKHQIVPFTDYAIDQMERLERAAEQENA
ncbi:hypothetical protein [Brachybacterium sp. J153]|uniref:hypothetical protein n=1 Tax=Brachybacterium sp. J153 TaxID=3116488 RepID=UPI002E7670D0|nr:hypothetical protein [Brachybacterium sp. J153]MEE1617312.1 hypothetical protein [Brachybacterium sp. J153]